MRSQIIRIVDQLLLVVLGLFCLRYALFDGRDFAELRVQFPFLDFPVFIGEFLLAGCFVLFVIKWFLAGYKMNKWYWLLAGFFGFVIVKAVTGYIQWGPLAFRDAALFYYVAFAVFAYHAYRREYTNRFVILFCYGLVFLMVFDIRLHDYWYLSRIFLGLALAFIYPDRRTGSLMAAAILVFSPHKFFLETNRKVILANFIAFSFVVIASTSLLGRETRRKILIGAFAIVAALGLYLFKFSGYVPAQTIFKWSKTAEEFRKLDIEVEKNKRTFDWESFHARGRGRVYNPDTDRIGEGYRRQAVVRDPYLRDDYNPAPLPDGPQPSLEDQKIGNALFRLFIWRDAAWEIVQVRPLLGFDFGKPFLAMSLVMVRAGVSEWERDGWISIHNAYLNIVFRAGVVGIFFIAMACWVFVYMTRIFIRVKSISGLMLCGVILAWMIMANFAVLLELPYGAIPVWTIWGFTLAFAHDQLKKYHAHSDRP